MTDRAASSPGRPGLRWRRLAAPAAALRDTPGAWRLELGASLYRLGGGVPLALLLLVRETSGSTAFAAGAVALHTAARAAASPLRGRMLDRRPPRAVLLPLAAVQLTALAGVAIAASADGTGPALLGAAAVAGAAQPPVGTAMRTAWRGLLTGRESQLPAAYSFETALNQLGAVLAPLVTGLCAGVLGPAAALLVASLLLASGAALFACGPADGHAGTARATARPPGAGRWSLVAIWAVVGAAIAALELLAPLTLVERGSVAGAGTLVAALAAGTFAGGLVAGARPAPSDPPQALAWQLAALTLCALMAFATAAFPGPWIGLALVACGAWHGAAVISAGLVLDAVTPRASANEAFGWLLGAYLIGSAAGTSLAGVIAEQHGTAAAFALPAGAGLAATLLTLGARSATLLGMPRAQLR